MQSVIETPTTSLHQIEDKTSVALWTALTILKRQKIHPCREQSAINCIVNCVCPVKYEEKWGFNVWSGVASMHVIGTHVFTDLFQTKLEK